MISFGYFFILISAFFLILLHLSAHPFFSPLGKNGLLCLVTLVLVYSVGYEFWSQWPLLSLRPPGYFLFWPS